MKLRRSCLHTKADHSSDGITMLMDTEPRNIAIVEGGGLWAFDRLSLVGKDRIAAESPHFLIRHLSVPPEFRPLLEGT
jgi:hypothetical protein